MGKNPPAVQETQFPPLGREDPPEEEMATPLQYSYLGNPTDRGASGHKELDTPELLTLFSIVDQEREQF